LKPDIRSKTILTIEGPKGKMLDLTNIYLKWEGYGKKRQHGGLPGSGGNASFQGASRKDQRDQQAARSENAQRHRSDEEMVIYEKYGRIQLTPAGKKAAQDVFRRHEILRRFLIDVLDMDPEKAAEDACRMEHAISATALERLAKLQSLVQSYPDDRIPWLSSYRRYLEYGELPERPD
jgi:Mn-dependent DtxR family transcriptional regulator